MEFAARRKTAKSWLESHVLEHGGAVEGTVVAGRHDQGSQCHFMFAASGGYTLWCGRLNYSTIFRPRKSIRAAIWSSPFTGFKVMQSTRSKPDLLLWLLLRQTGDEVLDSPAVITLCRQTVKR